MRPVSQSISKTDLPEVQHLCEAGRIRTRTEDAGDDDKGDGELSTAESLRCYRALLEALRGLPETTLCPV